MRARQEEGMRGGRDERGLDNTRSEGDQRKGGGSYGNQEGGLGGGGEEGKRKGGSQKITFLCSSGERRPSQDDETEM